MRSSIEQQLSNNHHQRHALLTGSATASIYLALKALGISGKVGIPNNVCINIPIAIKMSGCASIQYIDVSEDDWNIDITDLEKYINSIDVLILVHSFGVVSRQLTKICELCQKHNVPIIEDCATAQGSKTVNGQPIGQFGEVSVFSFGSGKIIDIEHGGAILTNNKSLFNEIVRQNNTLPPYISRNKEIVSALGQLHTQLYNKYYFEGKFALGKDEFLKKLKSITPYFLYQFDDKYSEILSKHLSNLDKNLSHRLKIVELFKSYLRGCDEIEIIEHPINTTYWRLNLRVKKNRDDLFKFLLSKKYKVSSWYPPTNVLFENIENQTTNCQIIGDSIINLWINQEADESYVFQISNDILNFYN